jgi:CRP-like cAMP-binding protein
MIDASTGGAEITALAQLRGHAQSYRLRRRQALPAATADTVYIVRSGLVAAEHSALPSGRTMVELLYPGDIISPSLLPLTPGLTHTTMSATELWRLSLATLKSEMSHDAALTDFVLQRLNLQRARMQLHISMLAGLTSEQRVAGLLLQAACHLGVSNGGAIAFDMPLSRNEVAEYLALNADTLSRIMSRLVRENVLARSSRAQITIRDLDALKAHCPLSDAVTALHSTH